MSLNSSVPNAYQPAREMSCETCPSNLLEAPSKRPWGICVSVVSIVLNLVALGMIAYAVVLITSRSSRKHTYALGVENSDFTPLQLMRNMDLRDLPSDANVLLKYTDDDAVSVRLYRIKSVQTNVDKTTGTETSRTFNLSMGHKLVLDDENAVLYDVNESRVLAKYQLKPSEVSTAELNAEELHGNNSLRKLYFTKDKMKKPYMGGGGYYGSRYPYCPYCGMYPYRNWGTGFPFGGGYPYYGGFGMGGFRF